MALTFDPCKPLKTRRGGLGSKLTPCVPQPARAAAIMVAMRIEKGQPVLIKRFLVGTVLEDRPGDSELPPEKRCYMVHVSEDNLVCRPSDLVAVAEPSNTLTKLSPEWSAEFSRWLEAGNRFQTDNTDRTAWDDFSAAGSKLGFFVPIKEE
jgi:hypothetical protein